MRARHIVLGLGAIPLLVLLAAALIVVPLRLSSGTTAGGMEFSIGPPSGRSASVGPDGIRADGITLLAAIAIAYDKPSVRVIGPSWLSHQRYSLHAVLTGGPSEAFRPLLKQELDRRLHLVTHLERRPFDLFVLSASDRLRLERSATQDSSTWLGDDRARLRGTDMRAVAAAVQGILGAPVVDETKITGWYDLDFTWSGDRVLSMTALLRDRYGLRLERTQRELEALVVDAVRRDAALVLLSQVGRAAQGAPAGVRRDIAEILKIH